MMPATDHNTEKPALLSPRHTLCGSVTTKHIARFLSLYTLLVIIGLSISQLTHDPHWQTFGLGLMLPAGGFLAHADMSSVVGLTHIGIAILGMTLFGLALIGWFATGNVLLPPFVWLLLAVIAATMNHNHVHADALMAVPILILCMALGALCYAWWRQSAGMRERQRANDYLAATEPFANSTDALTPEFSLDDLKRMRFLLDRALQPVHDFNGFEWLDQFQTAAVRYQINFIGYALSMAQATHLPAFSGYMHTAQKQLIEKLTDHRVWKYWASENLWGNLRNDPDPIAHENIMYTGLATTQMAMYHGATGQRDYEQQGSFQLRHPSGKNYAYDLPALVTTLTRDTQRSPFHLIACEPNWIYPLCNTIGAAGIRAYAPHQWTQSEQAFCNNLENEFIDLQGRIVPCRSRYTGFALPVMGGVMPQALPCFFMNATLPDIALRQWMLLRRDMIDNHHLRRENFWRIDTGNYKFSPGAGYAVTALAAAELGDNEIRDLCFAAIEQECPATTDNGHAYRSKMSVWAHATEFLARSTARNSFRNLIVNPRVSVIQPHINSASYPAVLVASAAYNDGLLKAVVYPGDRRGRLVISLAGLAPHETYLCKGSNEETIVADYAGNAMIHVMLDGRKELQIHQQT